MAKERDHVDKEESPNTAAEQRADRGEYDGHARLGEHGVPSDACVKALDDLRDEEQGGGIEARPERVLLQPIEFGLVKQIEAGVMKRTVDAVATRLIADQVSTALRGEGPSDVGFGSMHEIELRVAG